MHVRFSKQYSVRAIQLNLTWKGDVSVSKENNFDAQNSNIGLYKRIVEGLKEKPAYLLVFAISALFVLAGIGTYGKAILDSDLKFGVLGTICFALALITVIVVVIEVERKEKVRVSGDDDHHPSNAIDPDAELVLNLKEKIVPPEDPFFPDLIVGIARSGLIVAGYLSKQLTKKPKIPVISLWRKRDTVDYQNSFNHISFDRREFNLSEKDPIKILIVDAFCITGDTLKLAKDFIENSIGSEDVLIKTAAVIFRIDTRDRVTEPDYRGIETREKVFAFGEKE